jgi:dTDP-glucose pyrophosphorylase
MMRSDKFAYVKKVQDLVVDIQEKESYTAIPMEEEASSGCYGFASGRVLLQALDRQIESAESLNGEYYISLTYRNLLQRGNRIGTVLMKRFFQWGTPEDLQDWEYWNSVIQKRPGTTSGSINAHNIVLAAGRGLRIAELAKVAKPNLVISGQHLWEYSAPKGIAFRSSRIVTRPEVGIINRDDVEIVSIDKVTDGQAISAKIGIDSVENPKGASINVLSSDNAFTPEVFALAADLAIENDLVIWTSSKYPLSKLNPSQFAWVNLSEKKVIVKDSPPNFVHWAMIIGSFTFRNHHIALSLIDELIAQDIRVNNEFYLDSIINIAFAKNMKVITLEVDNFIAIGTPEEFLTYRYFNDDRH